MMRLFVVRLPGSDPRFAGLLNEAVVRAENAESAKSYLAHSWAGDRRTISSAMASLQVAELAVDGPAGVVLGRVLSPR